MEKRKSAYMRFGRSAPSEDSADSDNAFENLEKRKSAYMRYVPFTFHVLSYRIKK